MPPMGLIEQMARAALRPPDSRLVFQWCEEFVRVDRTSALSPGQKWRAENSPWVCDLLENWANDTVTDIAVRCAAQAAKTQTILCGVCYSIAEDPGPMLWVTASREDVRTFVATRLNETFENCPPVKGLMPADGGTATQINFATMPFEIVGAGSKSKLQSRPIRYLILDEARNYKPGALDMVLKRTRTYWNAKRIIISTGDKENDAVDRAFKAGDQRRWYFPCPKCGQLQTFKDFKNQFRFDKNETTFPGGKPDMDKIAETIRLACVACGHEMRDTPEVRKHIINRHKGRWIRTNPSAPKNRVSYTWPAMIAPWVKWRDVVEEYLMALAALKSADIQPLKAFVNETLGESWEDKLGVLDDFDILENRRGAYKMGDDWKDEAKKRRLMAVDVQKDHFYFVIRDFAPGGKSRLVRHGKVWTDEQLDEAAKQNGVAACDVMIDSGHAGPRVYRYCAKYGWKAFRGTDALYFPGKDRKTGEAVRRIWSKSKADPAMGTEMQGRVKLVKLYLFATDPAKDMLGMAITGQLGEWSFAADVERYYYEQMSREQRVERTDARGRSTWTWIQLARDNHIWDCEVMLTVASVILGLVGGDGGAAEEEDGGEGEGKKE